MIYFDKVLQIRQTNSNLERLQRLRKTYQPNSMIGYFNITWLKNKIISVREISQKAPIDILYIDKFKLDASFPDSK